MEINGFYITENEDYWTKKSSTLEWMTLSIRLAQL